MSLTLDFSLNPCAFEAWGALTFPRNNIVTLQAVDRPNAVKPNAPVQLSMSSLIGSGKRSTTYRGSDGSRLFVVKFALWSGIPADNLETEFENYEKLSHLQGTAIPHFFGYYRGEKDPLYLKAKSRAVSCIVIEDCGESLHCGGWYLLDQQPTIDVFNVFAKMHMDGGVHHRDFEPWNVVERNGVYRIIDLDDIYYHECNFDGRFVSEDGGYRWIRDLCVSLDDVAHEARYWKKGPVEKEEPKIEIGFARFPTRTMPPQYIVDFLVPPCVVIWANIPAYRTRIHQFFYGVQQEHKDLGSGEDGSELPYSMEELEGYKEWWVELGLPVTPEEARRQARYKGKDAVLEGEDASEDEDEDDEPQPRIIG